LIGRGVGAENPHIRIQPDPFEFDDARFPAVACSMSTSSLVVATQRAGMEIGTSFRQSSISHSAVEAFYAMLDPMGKSPRACPDHRRVYLGAMSEQGFFQSGKFSGL
jgi:hypothetical protein